MKVALKSMFGRLLLRTGAFYGVCGLAYLTFPSWPESQLKYNVMAVAKNKTQSLWALWTVYTCVQDYRSNVEGLFGTEAYREELRQFHLRTAEKIFKVCSRSKGLYIKFGQYVSTLDRVIPKEVADVLKRLQDQVPPHELRAMEVVLDASLPDWRTHIYKIEETPIGSASLAQVHRAEMADGTTAALKIQYPELFLQFDMDLRTLASLSRKAGRMLRRYGMESINVEEIFARFRDSIRSEMDFVSEIRNGEKTRLSLSEAGNDSVVVPRYNHSLSSDRVITMEFMSGVRVDDVTAIKERLGLEPRAVGNALVDLYLGMTFDSGLIHCDPHPGNILVRNHPFDPKRPQLVLLDHGFYRSLSSSLQDNFTALWMALVNRDNEKVKSISRWFGIEKKANYLGLIFLFRTRRSGRMGESFSAEEISRLRDMQVLSLANVSDMLGEFPDDFLMIIRTMNMVAMRNAQLGNSQRDRLLKTTRKVYQRYYGYHFWWRFFYAIFRVKLWFYETLIRTSGTELDL